MSTTFDEQARASIELIDKRSAGVEFTPHPALSPMQELQMQIVKTGDLDRLQKLMDLEERWRKNQALTAYNEAMAQFKSTPHTITKNKHVGFESKNGGMRTDYWHATLDNVCACIVPALAAVGLRHAWNVAEAQGQITVTCTVTHHMGHSECVSLSGPLDATGNKNTIQQKGSTITYLERYTLLAITGLAATDQDTDGTNGATPQAPKQSAMAMDGFQLQDYLDAIKGATDPEEARAIHNEAWDKANKLNDRDAIGRLLRAKDARLVELRGKQ